VAAKKGMKRLQRDPVVAADVASGRQRSVYDCVPNSQPVLPKPDPQQAVVAAELAQTAARLNAEPELAKAFAVITGLEPASLGAAPSASPLVTHMQSYLAPPGSRPFVVELGKRAVRDQFWRQQNLADLYTEPSTDTDLKEKLQALIGY